MNKNENGAIMIEGILVMVVVMFMLIWILGIGFIYYQRNLVATVTNDCAVKIADTYYMPTSDLKIGYVSSGDFKNRDIYRFNLGESLINANKKKASSYISKRLQETNFLNTVKDVKVDVKFVNDSITRKHVEVSAVCTFNTPFGAALEYFGSNKNAKYEFTAREDCTDKIDYISICNLESSFFSGSFNSDKISQTAKSVGQLIKDIKDVTDHNYD